MAQKILLVEDDPCFGSVLKSYLELSDYEVTLCVNGNDGLEAFRKDKFDICLLDVMMPEMDGFTLKRSLAVVNTKKPSLNRNLSLSVNMCSIPNCGRSQKMRNKSN